MQISNVQRALLQAIADGSTTVQGPDTHTLKRLIILGLAIGFDASSSDGDVYESVELTEDGKGSLNDR